MKFISYKYLKSLVWIWLKQKLIFSFATSAKTMVKKNITLISESLINSSIAKHQRDLKIFFVVIKISIELWFEYSINGKITLFYVIIRIIPVLINFIKK